MKVGNFFKVKNEFLIDSVEVEDGEPYGDSITYDGHFEYHEKVVPTKPLERRFKVRDYDFYPRGRVVFNTVTNFSRIYVDPCLILDDINRLVKLFELEGQQVETAGDEHYHCANCNRIYVNFYDEYVDHEEAIGIPCPAC